MKAMADQLGARRVVTSPIHPKANGCVEHWNRTSVQDLPCFVSAGSEDWDSHVTLACFRYNTGVNEATGIATHEAMFGVSAFMSWGSEKAKRVHGEPYNLSDHLRGLHGRLPSHFLKARKSATDIYDRDVREMKLEEDDRVLLWSPELASKKGNMVARPWLGPYCTGRVLSPVSYLPTSEIGEKTARIYRNRNRNMPADAKQMYNASNGVFTDARQLSRHIRDSNLEVTQRTRWKERWFKFQVPCRKLPKATKECDVLKLIFKPCDQGANRRMHPFDSTDA